jgi:hypothetical protein
VTHYYTATKAPRKFIAYYPKKTVLFSVRKVPLSIFIGWGSNFIFIFLGMQIVSTVRLFLFHVNFASGSFSAGGK